MSLTRRSSHGTLFKSFDFCLFIFEGIITGVVGALISFVLISWGYIFVYSKAQGVNMDVFSLLPYSQLWSVLLICFISIG